MIFLTNLLFFIPVYIPICHNRVDPLPLRILFICGLILREFMILVSLLSALICVINYVKSLDYIILLKYVISIFTRKNDVIFTSVPTFTFTSRRLCENELYDAFCIETRRSVPYIVFYTIPMDLENYFQYCFLICLFCIYMRYGFIEFFKFYIRKSRSILSICYPLLWKRTLIFNVLGAALKDYQYLININENLTHLVYHIFKSIFLNFVWFRMTFESLSSIVGSKNSLLNRIYVNFYNMTYFNIKIDGTFRCFMKLIRF